MLITQVRKKVKQTQKQTHAKKNQKFGSLWPEILQQKNLIKESSTQQSNFHATIPGVGVCGVTVFCVVLSV